MRISKLTAVPLVALALIGAACGNDDSTVGDGDKSPSPSPSVNALFAKLPASIQASKVIKVGSDIAYAPVEFYDKDGKTALGIDPDLAAALGAKLGVTFQFQNAIFNTIIPSLKTNRFDIIMSAMSDTKERQKEIDFVDYFNAGTSIVVKKGNPQGIQSLDDLCGKTIALQKGTTQEDVAKEQQGKCTAAGKNKIKVLTFDTDSEALLQVKSGRAVADMNDFPVAAYSAKTVDGGNASEVVGEQIGAGPYGIGVPKDQAQLRDAIQAALQAIIADGTYDTVLAKWNATGGALKTAAINGG